MAEDGPSAVAGTSVGAAMRRARARLAASGITEADADARRLLGAALGLDAAGLLLRADRPLEPDEAARLAMMLDRRAAGEPVGRILGRRAFGDHEFALSPETLEPRPDTETLVDLAADRLSALKPNDAPLVFADLGTGSGAIAVSLLARLPGALCVAVDWSFGALLTARENARGAGVATRFLPVRADFSAGIGGPLHAIVANPPYIPSGDIDALAREVRNHDPRLALDGGADGLDAYRAIASGADVCLGPGGLVLLEIGFGQEDGVGAVMDAAGFRLVERRRDLRGIVRALAFARTSDGAAARALGTPGK